MPLEVKQTMGGKGRKMKSTSITKHNHKKWIILAGMTTLFMAPLITFSEDVSQKSLADIVLKETSRAEDITKALGGITDKDVLKGVLLNIKQWESRAGAEFDTKDYMSLCKRLDSQDAYVELLHGSMPQLSVYSYGSFVKHGSDAIWELVGMLDDQHLAVLDQERKARRRSVKGQVVNCLGFYPGMPFVDYVVLMRTKYSSYIGKDDFHRYDMVSPKAEYDYHPTLPMCAWAVENIRFNPKFYFSECGIGDGLEGLIAFAEKYVPGGSSNYGEPKIDLDNEGWSVISPKTDTTIVMNKDSMIRLISGKTDIRLDFSNAPQYMNDAGDDDESDAAGGGFFSFIFKLLILAGIIWALCHFKKNIDSFVNAHPKYAKAWGLTCKAGTCARKSILKAYAIAQQKVSEIKAKKTTK